MYNEKQIRQLLTRFMEGQTTEEEEQEIARWFAARPKVAPDLEDYRQMFAYFDAGMPEEDVAATPVTAGRSSSVARSIALRVAMIAAACVAVAVVMTLALSLSSPSADSVQIAAVPVDTVSGAAVHAPSVPKADSVKSEKPKARRYHKYMYTPAPPHPLYAEARRKEFVDSLSDAIDAFVAQCVEEAQRDDEQLYQQAMMEGANRENAIVNEALALLEEEVY